MSEERDAGTADTMLGPVLEALGAVHAITTEPASSSPGAVPTRPRRNSQWRGNRILGRVVPPLLLAFILNGWHYMQTVMSPYIRITGKAFPSYMLVFDIMITTLVTLFLIVWLGSHDHSAPTPSPPSEMLSRSISYECIDESGNLAYCWQDDCNGRWLPPRTRHCKDCRVCRVDFDHCCVFFGTCIAEGNLFLFTIFLLTVAPTIALGLWQVTPVALQHRRIVMDQLWLSDLVYERWWNRWYSWVGGPVFRWGAGLLYSFWLYRPVNAVEKKTPLPPVSFTPILYTIFGPLLSVFCLALAWVAIRNVLLAGSTIDTIRAARGNNTKRDVRLVWVPDTYRSAGQGQGGGKVHALPKAINVYDFGKKRNFRNFISRLKLLGYTYGQQKHETWTLNEEALEKAIEAERKLL